ncbi:PREDICTED: MICOS complex subunit Mic60 isoform X1 [Trachymyrmex septentrionalis]|uniref:MICOS complex subunit Mic60 isoform X1 n=1 Tax=Trachymyrmex septentrionalis TaxID=34720 RepID=UPI00084F249B|nr:PREDICTED: MICOS complex subunit Mic60 isoform X1 [Trachymyrmex septentrionalis]
MFRIGLKFPYNGLNRLKKHGSSRPHLIARYYESRARIKYEPDGRLYRDVRFISRFTGPRYSTAPKSVKSQGSGILITLGAVTIGTLGILTYAKGNPKVRATLEGWIPGTDETIRIIFQEDKNSSYFDFVLTFFETVKQTILGMFIKEAPEPGQTRVQYTKIVEYIPPKPAFKLADQKEAPINKNYAEIHISKDKGEKVDVVAEKLVSPAKIVRDELIPQNLIELETYCGEAAGKAIAAYQKAVYALQEYNQNIAKVIESTGTTVNGAVWQRLKEATEKKKQTVQQAEEHAKDALDSLKRMYNSIDEPVLEAAAHMKTAAKRNIRKIMDDVDEAKKKYTDELQSGNVAERYWKQVQTARENFNEELHILFPNINIHDKKLSVSEEAFDLFVLHMYHKVNNLQKELEKLRTVNENKVKAALKTVGEDATQEKLNALISLEVNRERLELVDKLAKESLSEQKKFVEEMRRQLKLLSEIHADHLREALLTKELETQRMLQRAVCEQADADSIKYKTQLAEVVGRSRAVAAALKARMEEEKGASNIQILWASCQALARTVKAMQSGAPKGNIIKPLEPEIKAIYKAAPKTDPLVRAAIQTIPEEAAKRGVLPEDTLRERFLKVESVARRLAMVPEGGAALPIYLLSYLQSFLIIKTANPIPKRELEDEPIDVDSLNTYDILQRARYWLDRGDFKMTLRYMNLLKGAPRSVARDWMNETRILLETQQAVDTLLAYAGATGLVYHGAGDPKCCLNCSSRSKAGRV